MRRLFEGGYYSKYRRRGYYLFQLYRNAATMATALINTYRRDTELYIDGITLYSQEGTTQGDPLAMPMYALAVLPLIKEVNPDKSVIQSWYADNASAAGSVSSLREWWDALVTLGPRYGYYVNPTKTYLIVKECHRSTAANTLFRTRKLKLLMMANHTSGRSRYLFIHQALREEQGRKVVRGIKHTCINR